MQEINDTTVLLSVLGVVIIIRLREGTGVLLLHCF